MYPSRSFILGQFIKECRSRITPEECGISSINRRRVKGLRREELAELSGISTTWITWIEQGRSQSLSALTLNSICNALKLEMDERIYAFTLANLYDYYHPPERSARNINQSFDLTREVLQKLDYPCFISNRKFDLLCLNQKAKVLFRELRSKEFDTENNLLVHTFLNPLIKESIQNWESFSSNIVAKLRFNLPVLIHDSNFIDLVSRLEKASSDFCRHWNQHDVVRSTLGTINLSHSSRSFTHKAFYVQSNQSICMNILIESP